jgi:hypothetical protein
MSRAFIKEGHDEPTPKYQLPDPESPYYKEAAAWALIRGADQGDSRSAELATSYSWGDPTLVPCILSILKEAETAGEDRVAQLARRFLKAAGYSEYSWDS